MKRKIWLAAACAIFWLTSLAYGAAKTSAELGKDLFNDPKLGGSPNESSCSSCHGGGKGLENTGSSKKLTKLINNCLVSRMAGEKLDGRKVPMRSLKLYIQSFNN